MIFRIRRRVGGCNFENSAFFEIFETTRSVVHVFEIRRFGGRAYRFPASLVTFLRYQHAYFIIYLKKNIQIQVYSSDARDTFSVLPRTNEISVEIDAEGGVQKLFRPGVSFDKEPSQPHAHGLIFGNLTTSMAGEKSSLEQTFYAETWQNIGTKHTEVWRDRQYRRVRDSANRLDNSSQFEEVKQQFINPYSGFCD